MREDSDDGELEHEHRDWDKEIINPNHHADLKLPPNGVSLFLCLVFILKI